MMLRKLIAAALVALIALSGTSALAARYVTNGQYTAYAGADSYLYLLEPDGSAKRLKVNRLDILSMDEEKLYYASGDNVYSIVLAASQAVQEMKDADEDALMSYRMKGAFTLVEGTLYLGEEEVAGDVVCASANSSTLYYIQEGDTTLYSMPLKGGEAKEHNLKLKDPQALAAADSHLLVLDDGDVTAYETAKMKKSKTVKMPKGDTTDMFLAGKTLNLYVTDAEDEETLQAVAVSFIKGGGSVITAQEDEEEPEEEAVEEEPEEDEETYDEEEEAVEEEEEEEEPKKTTKKTTKKSSSSSDDDFKVISRGIKGARVKEVQKRLKELGYSVGTVDGSYGSKSIRATRAFQTAAGLEADGRVDQETWDALFSDDAPENPKK